MEPTKLNTIEDVPGLVRPQTMGDGMLSTATPAANERINRPAPVMAPAPWVPVVLGGVFGALAAVGTVFSGVTAGAAITWPMVVGAICTGIATGAGAALGIRSGGVRQ
jgi:hypothetical protein